ncbi:MAG: group 1 truncated hemoglobin [Curvibacter sp.]|nr:group 1 truncated hemoglobin [Curvibacter sp.]
MKIRLPLALTLLCLAVASGAMAQTRTATDPVADPAALYRSFGEKAGLALLMDDFVHRLAADPRISDKFKNTDLDHLKSQLTEQLCQVAGGPCHYQGPDMAAVHAEMGVGKGHFNALVEDLQKAMEARSIPFSAQNQMLARLAPMHRDIITQ